MGWRSPDLDARPVGRLGGAPWGALGRANPPPEMPTADWSHTQHYHPLPTPSPCLFPHSPPSRPEPRPSRFHGGSLGGSPIIMNELIVNKQDPVWICWLSHVAVIRFCVRHAYVRGTDGAALDALHQTFLKDFNAVPQWLNAGYEKPKFHPAEHLAAALDEFGPFRAFWCMPWESYLQILKRMFNMCNWKSAPWTVATHWATKSVMHYRDPARGTWYTDKVVSESDWTCDLSSLARGSQMVSALLQLGEPLQSVRPISRVTRGPDEVRRGDWVVVRQANSPARAGKVEQMMQCLAPGGAFSFVRLWCANVKEVHDDEESCVMWADLGDSRKNMVVSFEKVHVEVVVHSVCGTRDEFI